MSISLENYTLVYQVVSPPFVFFAQLTKANSPLHFSEALSIPKDVNDRIIDCYFSIYDSEGILVELTHERATYLTVTSIVNLTPMKMLKKLVLSLKQQSS